MSAARALVAASLAAAAVACLLAVPPVAALRLRVVQPVSGTERPRGRARASARSRLPVALPVALLGLVAPAAVLLLAGAVPALLTLLALAVGARAARGRARRTAQHQERARAVEACGGLAAELRAGRTPADALAAAADLAAGPSRTALVAAAGTARLGGDVSAALQPPPSTAVPDVLRALAACWSVCSSSGGGLAAAAERLEEGLRSDQAQRRALDAELAGPRATAALLAVLPAGGLLLAAGLGADPLHVLLHTPVGLVCLALGLLLDGAGLWWTGQLVQRAGGTG